MTKPEKIGNILTWAHGLDDKVLDQAHRTAAMPFLEGHLALMPDAHWGMGATIGSVIPTRGAIIPAAVGVDIGCGMIAVETPFTSDLLSDDLTELHHRISQVVPAGMGQGHDNVVDDRWSDLETTAGNVGLWQNDLGTAPTQLGSLGGGNHFVEVCLDERDRVWVVLHSGSRGIGKRIADRHITTAKGLMKAWFIDLDDPDLAYLIEGTPEFQAYIDQMLWAQSYALVNREVMMDRVLLQLAGWIGHDFTESSRINCHHNFTQMEHHHGRNMWITRKGAIKADTGDRGVIPGSMGTRSYIVTGTGSDASYNSCSHGAGRRMGRKEAHRTLDIDGLLEGMAGKVWNDTDALKLLDEDPRAYKDIDQVMADQDDLVTIEHTLHQVLNYKGVT